jgi:uncharacterized membrane protein
LSGPKVTDTSIERMISILLRTGVLVAAAVVLFGGVCYLIRHGGGTADFHAFHGQPGIDRIIIEIIEGAVALRARSIIQFGILLLIATPIARVALSLIGFALERDWAYVAITAIVLAVLLYSLISGAAHG